MVGYIDFSLWLGVIGLMFSFGLYTYVKAQPVGNDVMADLADQIHGGAMAFLRREYTILVPFVIVVAGLLFWLIGARTAVAYGLGDRALKRVVACCDTTLKYSWVLPSSLNRLFVSDCHLLG